MSVLALLRFLPASYLHMQRSRWAPRLAPWSAFLLFPLLPSHSQLHCSGRRWVLHRAGCQRLPSPEHWDVKGQLGKKKKKASVSACPQFRRRTTQISALAVYFIQWWKCSSCAEKSCRNAIKLCLFKHRKPHTSAGKGEKEIVVTVYTVGRLKYRVKVQAKTHWDIKCIPSKLLPKGVVGRAVKWIILLHTMCSSPIMSKGRYWQAERAARAQGEREMCSQHFDWTELQMSAHFCNLFPAPEQGL